MQVANDQLDYISTVLQWTTCVGLVAMNVLVKLMYIIWETTSSLEHMHEPLDISRVTRELPKKLQLCTLQGCSHEKPSYREFIDVCKIW